MKNYIFVAVMVFTIAGLLVVYKSCTTGLPGFGEYSPNIGGLGTLIPNNVNIKPKPSTQVDTTTTTVVTPEGTSTTTIVDKTVINKPRAVRLDFGATAPLGNIKGPQAYDIGLSYRVLDHVWVGGTVGSDKKIGIRVGVEL